MRFEFIKVKNRINGVWLNQSSGQYAALRNLSTGAVIGQVPLFAKYASGQVIAAAAQVLCEGQVCNAVKTMLRAGVDNFCITLANILKRSLIGNNKVP